MYERIEEVEKAATKGRNYDSQDRHETKIGKVSETRIHTHIKEQLV
jgi:hypothetical protein